MPNKDPMLGTRCKVESPKSGGSTLREPHAQRSDNVWWNRQRAAVPPYSYLKASIGSSAAAFDAGMMPKITPTNAEKPAAAMTTHSGA